MEKERVIIETIKLDLKDVIAQNGIDVSNVLNVKLDQDKLIIVTEYKEEAVMEKSLTEEEPKSFAQKLFSKKKKE